MNESDTKVHQIIKNSPPNYVPAQDGSKELYSRPRHNAVVPQDSLNIPLAFRTNFPLMTILRMPFFFSCVVRPSSSRVSSTPQQQVI